MPQASLPEPFSCRAWLLDGPINSLPGVLQWTGQNVEFIAFGQGTFFTKGLGKLLSSYQADPSAVEAILNEEPQAVFSVPLAEISEFKIPWFYFGKGMKFQVKGRPSRISFIQPQNTILPARLVGFEVSRVFNELSQVEVHAPKSDIKLWKQLFA